MSRSFLLVTANNKQVLLAFLISVCMTYGIVLYAFYFVKDSFSRGNITGLDECVINAMQALCWPLLQLASWLFPGIHVDGKALRRIVLTLSDQQLVAGLAIVIVAYVQIKTITEYHFQVIVCLADLAFVVHTSTVDVIRDDLLERPAMKWWRVPAMLIFVATAMANTIPTGSSHWLMAYGLPTKCVWQNLSGSYVAGSYATTQMVLSMILQAWGMVVILNEFYPWLFDNRFCNAIGTFVLAVLTMPRQGYQHCRRRAREAAASGPTFWMMSAAGALLYSGAFFIFLLTEIIYSEAFDLLRGWGLLVTNAVLVFYYKSVSHDNGKEGNENSWGFGQILPMLLLFLPFASIFETIYGV